MSFEQEIVLVIIPTIAGVLTSKWITNSWQRKKEKSEIIEKTLEKFGESLVKDYMAVLTVRDIVDDSMGEYYKVAKTESTLNNLKSEKSQFIDQLEKYYNELFVPKKLWELNSFLSLYYEDKELFSEVKKLSKEIYSYYENVYDLVTSFESIIDPKHKPNYEPLLRSCYEKESQINSKIDEFKKNLIKKIKLK